MESKSMESKSMDIESITSECKSYQFSCLSWFIRVDISFGSIFISES